MMMDGLPLQLEAQLQEGARYDTMMMDGLPFQLEAQPSYRKEYDRDC